MNTRVASALGALLVVLGLVVGLSIPSAEARSRKKARTSARLIQAYGAWGRLPSWGDHRSPDRRFILRATHHDGDTTNVAVIDVKSGNRLLAAEDVTGFLWVPGKGHRVVVAACSIYGIAMLVMWESGKRWRSLHRVSNRAEECFALYGVTKDGKILIYGYDPGKTRERYPIGRRRRLRLPAR